MINEIYVSFPTDFTGRKQDLELLKNSLRTNGCLRSFFGVVTRAYKVEATFLVKIPLLISRVLPYYKKYIYVYSNSNDSVPFVS